MNRTRRYKPADELNLKVVIALLRAVKALEAKLAPCFTGGRVTAAQFGVLEFLYHKGPARISTIIEKTLSTGGNMTVVIRNLERQGLAGRCRDKADGRASVVALTPKGEALMKGLFPAHLVLLKEFMEVIGDNEKKGLVAALRRLPGREELGSRSCRLA